VVGRIVKVTAAPQNAPWMWTLLFGYHEDRTPPHGYEATREAAIAASAKSRRRQTESAYRGKAEVVWGCVGDLAPRQ